MEDNNVSNIEQNEITAQSMTSQAQGNLSFSENRDELSGGGGGGSSSSGSATSGSSSSGTTLSNSSSTSSSQSEQNNLIPVLLILGDEEPVDDEEPVLLEEDDSMQYTIEQNTAQTEIYTINADYKDNTYYTDEEHVIAVLDSNNNIVDNENNDGDIKITAKIDQSWCTVAFIHPLNSPFQQGKYKLSSTNFSYDNNIKVVVPVIHCEANTGNARTANITFQIQNLDTNLKMQVNQNASMNVINNYIMYFYFVVTLTQSEINFMESKGINTAGFINGNFETLDNYHSLQNIGVIEEFTPGMDSPNYRTYVSSVMYCNINYPDDLNDNNEILYDFIEQDAELTEQQRLIDKNNELSLLPEDYRIDINAELNEISGKWIQQDLRTNTHWQIVNGDFINPFKVYIGVDVGIDTQDKIIFGGYNRSQADTNLYNVRTLSENSLHLILYNKTKNTIVKNINWLKLRPAILAYNKKNGVMTYRLYIETIYLYYYSDSTVVNSYLSINNPNQYDCAWFGLLDSNNNADNNIIYTYTETDSTKKANLTEINKKFACSVTDIEVTVNETNAYIPHTALTICISKKDNFIKAERTFDITYDGQFLCTVYQMQKT